MSANPVIIEDLLCLTLLPREERENFYLHKD